MSCKFTIKNLTFFLDDEIQAWKRSIVKHHLKKCKKCQKEFEKVQKSNDILISALKQKELYSNEEELWQNISTEIHDTNTEIVKPDWKLEKTLFRNKSFYYAFGVVLILLTCILSLSQFWPVEQKQISFQPEVEKEYPIVESVNKENVMVMTYLTDDPNIKIVWFFED